MPNSDFERLILDENSDVLRIVLPGGMEVEFTLSPEQMVEVSVWAFTRKTVHIINGERRVDPFAPIPQGRPRDAA